MSDSVKNIRAKVYLNGKEANGTLRDMTRESKKLLHELSRIPTTSKRFKEARDEFRKLRGDIRKIKDEIYGTNEGFRRFKSDTVSNLKTVIGTVATFSAAWAALRGSINYQKELSDLRADVQKTTELSEAEMDIFQARLDNIDTRTSREELLKLAAQAGKLGVRGVADLEKFVEQADKINVALGDDLGSDAVISIGKVADVFRTDLLTIGNAINKIADNSKAAAPFLVEFLSRLGGSAKSAGIGASEILGYGATLDELGLKVEMSSTALSGFFIDFVKNTEVYGKAAGFANGELTKLIGSKGTNQGFVAFLERLKEASPTSDVFLRKLEEIGINGDRGSQVFLALSQNLDKVKSRQELANTEMLSGDSILQEFLKRNTNFAATLEKIEKWFRKTFLDSALSKGVANFITYLAQMAGIIEDTDGSAKQWADRVVFIAKMIVVATAGVISYQAALKLAALWGQRAAAAELLRQVALKASAFWTSTVISAQALYITSTNLLTGQITLATAAQRIWNTVIYASPIGWIAGLVVAATTAYFLFRKEQEKGLAIDRLRNDLQSTAASAIADERSKLEGLLAIAKDETQAKKDRLEAIKQLRELAPEYLGDLDLETIKTDQAKEAIENYVKSLERKAMAEALQAKRTELFKKLIEAQSSTLKENTEWYDYLTSTLKSYGTVVSGNAALELSLKGAERRNDKIKAIEAEIEALNKLQAELLKTGEIDLKPTADPENPNPVVGAPEGDNEAIDKMMKRLESQYEMELRVQEDYAKRRKELFDQYEISPEEDEALKEQELERLQQFLEAEYLTEEEYAMLADAVDQKYHDKAIEREEEKRKEYEKTAEYKEKMMRRDAAISAFNAAANARSAEEAKSAVLNNIREQIKAYLAKAIAGAIAQEFASKGILGAVTGALAGGAAGILFNQLVPRFNTGGYTSSAFGMPDPFVPGRKIAGFAHDNEYVVASEELRNPDTNLLVRAIESVRQGRISGNGSAGINKTVTTTQTVTTDPLAGVVAVLAKVVQDLQEKGIKAVADDDFQRDMLKKQMRDEQIESNSRIE